MKTSGAAIRLKLSNSGKPYAYWLAPEAAQRIDEIVEELRFGIWQIDSRLLTDDRAAFQIIGEMFDFEGHFGPRWGRNWDAMIDGLRDLDSASFKGFVIVLKHADEFWQRNPTLYYKLLDVLGSVSQYWDEWKEQRIPFKTILLVTGDELRRVVVHNLS